MALPDINFDKIRVFDGSRNTAFEELCCQLASLEPRPTDALFFRKGRGGDAGVECFVRAHSGRETGWQAKYVSEWSSALAQQLDESIRTALKKHPKLGIYIVCIPFDLPDARASKYKTPLQHWEAWQNKWVKTAKAEGRVLEIILWSKSLIAERLTRDEPAYAGRLLYWFDQNNFASTWFTHQFEKARASLGSRYTPDTNVELPIRQEFLGLTRDPSLMLALHKWNVRIQEAAHLAKRAVKDVDAGNATDFAERFDTAVRTFVASIQSSPIPIDQPLPIAEWCDATKPLSDTASEALNWTYSLPQNRDESRSIVANPINTAQHYLYRLSDFAAELIEDLRSPRWHLANASALLVYGEAGTGKSHLFADVVEHQVSVHRPAILVLGSHFVDSDPWRQVLTAIDLPTTLQTNHFLAALDAAAEAAGVRALICIDALNERHGIDVWPCRLAAFLKEAKPFPRIAVALSCRSTYVNFVIPDTISEAELPRVEHKGFSGNASEAAKLYLDKRGIVRPGAPNLVPEFENPLFLKTCCDFLQKEGKRELPKGLSGVTQIFGFYVEAITRALNLRMKLDPHHKIVPRAIQTLASAIVEQGSGYLNKDAAIALLDAIHPSNGQFERSLLTQLESEGALAIEAVQLDDGSRSDEVRFTFERFSDHQIAQTLLDKYFDPANPNSSFAVGTHLHGTVLGEESYRRAGIIEALSIQLPERAKVELVDIIPAKSSDWYLHDPFMHSLIWRDQRFFSNRTFEILKNLVQGEELTAVLFSLATEPLNRFNASYLHKKLMPLSLPERDEHWTAVINRLGDEGGSIPNLISWAIKNGMESIENDRAELTAIALTWLLTSSNRAVRDRSTKALASLLANRLALACQLVQRFEKVNDLYVLERLFTAMYGAVLQGTAPDGHADLALAVYKSVFADGEPPPNALLRDSALGIIEYVKWRGDLPKTVQMKVVRPPYKSDWPIEYVSDELIETYKQKYGKDTFTDAIVGSVVTDGDFARYQLDHLIHHWCQSKRGTKKPATYIDIAKNWIDKFLARASDDQFALFEKFLDAAKENEGEHHGYKVTPTISKMNAAEQKFRKSLQTEGWEEYRVQARHFIRYNLFGKKGYYPDQIANFDSGWGRRWVCKRAHDLGWTSERFADIERYARDGGGRNEHRVERIGKKYQWLATYELAARMADHLAMVSYFGSRRVIKYEGAWQIGLRKIDPSLLVAETHYDGWQSWPSTWWVPLSPVLHEVSPEERLAWRNSEQDIVNDPSLIDVREPKTGRRWLTLDGFARWGQSGISDGSSQIQRDTWFRLNCLIAQKKDRAKLLTWLRNKTLTSSRDLPELELHGDQYLGEYPWHSSLADIPDWNKPDSWQKLPVATRTPVSSYSREQGSYDYSIEKTVRVAIPAPWLMKSFGLHLSNGRNLTYADKKGRVMFFDPSVSEPGPHAALVDRDAFLEMLEREGLAAFWVIAGEKNLHSGHRTDRGWGGRQVHTFVYELKKNNFVCYKHIEYEEPNAEQLSAYLAQSPRAALTKDKAPSRGGKKLKKASAKA